MKILDVGCGNNKAPGAIGIDSNQRTQADVIHDLNDTPYPFGNDEFDEVICNHIIEHVGDVIKFIEELHRIIKPGGILRIVTPHHSNGRAYADPTHRRYLSTASLDCFIVGAGNVKPGFWGRVFETHFPAMDFYSSARFEKVETRLSFGRPFRVFGISWLANRFLNPYEMYLAYIFPARDIFFVLKVVK